ncbi:hypothetical protein DFH07DRAFT_794576 [Mycena maculata]|uniref:Uncharacterized protein n=1 Tax=Mycena maculata TaxID=230809 RepID=A0AAD7K878_9AGAR|nr:hypothetical protein DFH07DRAFT_794576 [Mycena maculata]
MSNPNLARSMISPAVRRRVAILVVSSLISCIYFSSPMWRTSTPGHVPDYEVPRYALGFSTVTLTVHAPMRTGTLDDRNLLLGRPTRSSFRDNLRPDSVYITSWPVQEFSNQVVAFTNLIYLALITERVAIIPSFAPFHSTGPASSNLAFGEVFDMTRLRNGIGKPLLEWYQVKHPESAVEDVLGCWNTGRAARPPAHLNLDISYTTAPQWTLIRSDDVEEQHHAAFWSLAILGFPNVDPEEIEDAGRSPVQGISLQPDQHLLCFDDLSLVSARNPWEYSQEMSPAWRFVGQHMHWSSRIQYIADSYTRKALGIVPTDPIPPYIAVYARFDNVSTWCDLPDEECFPPLFAYARRVQELKAEFLRTTGIEVERVIMTSDTRELGWWDAVRKRGWCGPDHSRTARRYGAGYPVLIDAVIQSGALGFVTADNSMTSVLASRRVSSWQGGVVKRVSWETKRRQKEKEDEL